MSASESLILTQEMFDLLIEKYTNKFNDSPKSLSQLSTFCKEYGTNDEKDIKYSQLKSFYFQYNNKKNHKKTTENILSEGINDNEITQIDSNSLNYEEYWEKYIELFKYKPKNAKQLFNFLKNDMNINGIKYKDVRLAFNKLNIIYNNDNNDNNTNNNTKTKKINTNKNEIRLKIYHSTSDKVKNEIKTLFINILNDYKKLFNCYPKTAWNLFNYINDETEYKVKYGDVQFIMKHALIKKWYEPTTKETKTEKKKKIKKINKIISENEYNEIINEYKKEFKNVPKNAIQLMNFVNEYMKKGYKYNVIRVAFSRYNIINN